MPSLAVKPLGWFKTLAQARKHMDEAELRLLEASLFVKQLQPVVAKPDGTLIAGHRRLAAALLGKRIKELLVIITEEPLTESQVRIFQLTENIHRAELTGFEKWQACLELLALNPGWNGKDLAEQLKLDPSMIVRLMSPSKCIAAVQDALKVGGIGIKAAYEISQAPMQEQAALLAAKLSGSSAEEVAHQRRRGRNGSIAPQVRMSRVKIAMPQGTSVVISGKEMGMAEVVELLSETLKEARKAAEQFDVKTFQSMMRDKAK